MNNKLKIVTCLAVAIWAYTRIYSTFYPYATPQGFTVQWLIIVSAIAGLVPSLVLYRMLRRETK